VKKLESIFGLPQDGIVMSDMGQILSGLPQNVNKIPADCFNISPIYPGYLLYRVWETTMSLIQPNCRELLKRTRAFRAYGKPAYLMNKRRLPSEPSTSFTLKRVRELSGRSPGTRLWNSTTACREDDGKTVSGMSGRMKPGKENRLQIYACSLFFLYISISIRYFCSSFLFCFHLPVFLSTDRFIQIQLAVQDSDDAALYNTVKTARKGC
jgi:hypothetical protein